jgi:hypothetical protein
MELLILSHDPAGWALSQRSAAELIEMGLARITDGHLLIQIHGRRRPRVPSLPEVPTEEVLEWFPCLGSEVARWPLVRSMADLYQAAYPAVDIAIEAKRALAWVLSNPLRRKTYAGMGRYLHAWMSRCQDRGGSSPTTYARMRKPPSSEATRRAEAVAERERVERAKTETERVYSSWASAPDIEPLVRAKTNGRW